VKIVIHQTPVFVKAKIFKYLQIIWISNVSSLASPEQYTVNKFLIKRSICRETKKPRSDETGFQT